MAFPVPKVNCRGHCHTIAAIYRWRRIRIRSDDPQWQDENYDAVKAVLAGSNEGVINLDIYPGSLVIFEGRHSLHRVTRIEGDRLRLIALLGYDTKPGVVSSDYLRQIRYGRGGFKQSGWGKEMAVHSLDSYTRLKSV